MSNISINPSILFYRAYEEDILRTRESLFGELNGISGDYGNEARKLLEEKLKSNNNTPLLGELFPWIIRDLIKADSNTTHNISVGWLAIYLYTLFLDEHVDNPKPLNTAKFITGSLLAKTGLLSFASFTHNTPYENYIDNAFSFSAKNQHLDTNFQKINTEIGFKEKYSEGKNYVVLACAGALASQNSQHSEFIISFTSNLLLTLQFLDDIADFKEDFDSRNFTVLLNDAFKHQPQFFNSLKTISKRKLLVELIETGALQRVVEKVITLLEQSILIIKQNNFEKHKPSVNFFYSLKSNCSDLYNYLKKNQFCFNTLPNKNQSAILDNIENYIAIIAQST